MSPLPVLFLLFSSAICRASTPPVLSRSLASQLVPNNPAISSAFLLPSSSALLSGSSSSSPALCIPPSWSFSIGFSGTTFLPPPGGPQTLLFDARLGNGDPLPDWLTFDHTTITFGGVAPKHDIQVLKIIVTAASGTSSAATSSDTFTLIVAPHDLSLSGPLMTRNVVADNMFSFVINDWQGVQVDGAPVAATVSPNNVIDIDWATAPGADNTSPPLSLALDTASFPWLTYDATSRTLTGTPPASYANAPGPTIPAFVTLSFPPQTLTVSTNLTLAVSRSAFTVQTLPPLLGQPGTTLAFALSQYLSNPTGTLDISAAWDQQSVTWLVFDPGARTLGGTVPEGAVTGVKVTFVARDQVSGAVSRASMVISVGDAGSGGDGKGRLPTDRALRKTGKQVSVTVGVVMGVIASIIFLACFLALCRRCCAAHEHVDGAYVIDQSSFDDTLKGGMPYKSSLEKEEYGSGVDAAYLAPPTPPHIAFGRTITRVEAHKGEGRTMSKAAFFGAVRERFGSDGSWRVRRAPNASGSGGDSAGKKTRKSKISKPMIVLSSSTSVRDGFAERARSGNGKLAGAAEGNFTIFGGGNNAREDSPPARPPRADLSLSLGRVLMSPSAGSSAGTAILAYDRSRSNSDPSRHSLSVSDSARRSGSAPSLGTGSQSMGTQSGTRSGTQSTFATGESARLTNAAGEVPFRRSGFDGRRETLAERSMRETGSSMADRSVGSPGPIFPPRALLGAGDGSPFAKEPNVPPKTPSPAKISPAPRAGITPPKATVIYQTSTPSNPYTTPPKPASPATPLNANTSITPPKSGTSSKNGSSIRAGPSSKFSTPLQSSIPTKSSVPLKSSPLSTSTTPAPSKHGSPAPSSYRKVFFGDKGNDSDSADSSAEEVEQAVIKQAVKRGSSETPVTPGKARLVPFTHARTPAAGGQAPTRDVSQKAVLHSGEESDPEAEMRIGLEYVRQLGHPEAHASTSHAPDPPRTPSAEFYASNDSNGSIAGRTRVLAPLVISSHRHRHQTAYSTASTRDSFVSLAEREQGGRARVTLGANEPFSFTAPLDREAGAGVGSALEAKQADGRALPEWLRFDRGAREFWGVPPKAGKGERDGALVTRVVVKIWDGEKGVVVGGCVIDVVGEEG